MMTRTRISLDPELHHRARQRAARRRAAVVFDLGSSGGSDVARDKDAMVGMAFAARARGRRRACSSPPRPQGVD